jgi:hypothetical protein
MHRWEAFLQKNVENPHLDHAPPHILSMVNFSNLYARQAFCSGKSIRLIVGPAFGGFYDRWARIFARDTSKSVAGKPEIVARKIFRLPEHVLSRLPQVI